MNNKQKNVLNKIFDSQKSKNCTWNEVEKLFIHLGAKISEGKGSRIRVYLNGIRSVFHRPHPSPHLHAGHIRSIKKFLKSANIK